MSDIKVGDTVKIVDNGKVYSRYQEMADKLKLTKYTYGLSMQSVGGCAEVLGVEPHADSSVTVLGVLCKNGKEYLIGTEGVELVSKADPRAVLGKQLFGNKIKVNPTTSRLVQEAVFAAGGEWVSGDVVVLNQDSELLYCDSDGGLTATRPCFSKSNNYEEAVVSVTETLSIDEVIPNKTKEEIKKETLIKELEQSIMEASDKIKQLKEGGY